MANPCFLFMGAALVVGRLALGAASEPQSSDASPTPGPGEADQYWPQWRGPLGTGVSPHGQPPVEWSEKQNVRWKVELPGSGHSTPVVWGDRVFLTAAVPTGEVLSSATRRRGAHGALPVTQRQSFVVLAVSRKDGRILWERKVREALPHEGVHYTGSFAASSPLVDGEHVFAFFGSNGLYCLTLDGELVWEIDLGDMAVEHEHGEGSSPALFGNALIVNWDHEGQSFVVVLDKRSGRALWKVDRDEPTSWASPIVVAHDGKHQVVISGTNRVRAYDLENGEVIWECAGLSRNVTATPVAADGMVYVGSNYFSQNLLAIRLEGAQGDVTGTNNVVWSLGRGAPFVPSPLLYGDALYFLNYYRGILTRVHAKTGEDRPGSLRLEGLGTVYASPVAAGGRVYVTSREGATAVVRHDDAPVVLAVNMLDDSFSASAAIAGKELFLRGERYLYCLAEDG
ncbi:MAG: PQQ-binding-like beta-propeller repeat protein [Vicinamibacteria bacterium]